MFPQLLSIFAFGSLVLAAYGLGRPIVRGLGIGQEDRLSTVVWSVALGLIAAGLLLTALGLLGVLYVPVVFVITAGGCLPGGGEIVREHLAARVGASRGDVSSHRERPSEPAWASPPRWLSCGVLVAAGAACLGSLIGALAPPTAGDALCYHLELPKVFLAEHCIAYLPYHDNATFPLAAEMWFLWGLALEGGTCAQLVHWALGILLALGTVLLGTPIVGRRWAWIGGALVLLTPGINNQMTAPLNDVALAAMTTLALAAWSRAVAGEENRRWFIVAGLTAGAAMGTKYIALVWIAAVAATWIWALIARPQRRRSLVVGAAVVAVVAASVGGVWYVRAAWYRGNPVFPFFAEFLAGAEADAGPPRETLPQSKSPLGRSPAGLAIAPWQVTMHPEQFGGRGHQLGVLLLAAVPGVLLARRLRGLGLLLAVGLIYCAIWYLLRQNVRFLFPVVPPFCIVVAWVWSEMRRFPRPARWVGAAAFAGLLAVLAAIGLMRARGRVAVALGVQSREQYLLEHEPTYRAAAVANAVFGGDAHVLSQDYRAFYFNHRVTRENVYRRCTHYDRQITDPADVSRRLQDAGFTHLLLAETITRGGIEYDPTLSRLADAQMAAGPGAGLLTLTRYRFQDSDGVVRRYRLVMLR